MAHPFHHAVSSAKRFGGAPTDYVAIHSWFDATKAHFADARHRALRHHREGIAVMTEVFSGSAWSRLLDVSLERLGEQHVEEDLGCVVSAADWLSHLEPAIWMRASPSAAADYAEASARKWGGQAVDYFAVHAFLDRSAETDLEPERHRALSHHSEGIFLCEQFFGVTIENSRGRQIPTRWIAEQHVKSELGRIPSAGDWLRAIPMMPWMNRRLPGELRSISRS